MFERLLKKEKKPDDDMTVWVPKGVYNSVAPIWDERYAWHPMPVDDSMPMDQTSFIQVDNTDKGHEQNSESHAQAADSPSNENLAPKASADDNASVHSAVSTVPSITGPSKQASSSASEPRPLDKRMSFGFPVRQMSWNTSRRKREALLQRQKSRDKYGVPGKRRPPLTPVTPSANQGSPGSGKGPGSSGAVPYSSAGEFVMFAL